MADFLRRLRGVLGTSVSWGVSWSGLGLVLHALALAFGETGFFGPGLFTDILTPGLMGFLGGGLFAGGFTISERRKTLRQVKVSTGALWGMVAGLIGPGSVMALVLAAVGLNVGDVVYFLPTFLATGVLGAASGAAMTSLAKREPQALTEPEDSLAGHLTAPGPQKRIRTNS